MSRRGETLWLVTMTRDGGRGRGIERGSRLFSGQGELLMIVGSRSRVFPSVQSCSRSDLLGLSKEESWWSECMCMVV